MVFSLRLRNGQTSPLLISKPEGTDKLECHFKDWVWQETVQCLLATRYFLATRLLGSPVLREGA